MRRTTLVFSLITLFICSVFVWLASPPDIDIHGELAAADRAIIERLVRDYQLERRRSIMPDLSWQSFLDAPGAIRRRLFERIQCIYVLSDGRVQVECRNRKHTYEGYGHGYTFDRDSRAASGWRLVGSGSWSCDVWFD